MEKPFTCEYHVKAIQLFILLATDVDEKRLVLTVAMEKEQYNRRGRERRQSAGEGGVCTPGFMARWSPGGA